MFNTESVYYTLLQHKLTEIKSTFVDMEWKSGWLQEHSRYSHIFDTLEPQEDAQFAIAVLNKQITNGK